MINVIIVEDDPMVREINSKFLSKVEGFKIVGEASSIFQGKELLNTIQADLILLDVFLPDGKGIDFLKWIRINEIDIDTILVTADKGKTSVDEAFKYGAVDYLIKPFKFDRFKEALLKYKSMVESLDGLEDIDQRSIDEYILKRPIDLKLKLDAHKVLDKGLSMNTYNKIINYLISNKGTKLTAEEIAMGSGLARVTARRYLEKMVEESKLEVIQEYGRIGRPTNYYLYN